jgi:hypothetical protein
MEFNLTAEVLRSKSSFIKYLKHRAGLEGPARCVAQKDFGSVRSCCRCSEATKAPVEGEQHALDIDTDVVAMPEIAAPIAVAMLEAAVVVEIVEIGEAILAAKRQRPVGELPLEADADGGTIGIEVVVVMEENLALVVSDPEIALKIGKGPTSQAEDQQIGKWCEAGAPIDVDQAFVIVI